MTIALPAPGISQTFGEITGVVTDPSGAVLVSATVRVTNPQTNLTSTVTTNHSGNYAFPALLPGVYNVRAEMSGFQAEIRADVELQVQQTARIDFDPRLGPPVAKCKIYSCGKYFVALGGIGQIEGQRDLTVVCQDVAMKSPNIDTFATMFTHELANEATIVAGHLFNWKRPLQVNDPLMALAIIGFESGAPALRSARSIRRNAQSRECDYRCHGPPQLPW